MFPLHFHSLFVLWTSLIFNVCDLFLSRYSNSIETISRSMSSITKQFSIASILLTSHKAILHDSHSAESKQTQYTHYAWDGWQYLSTDCNGESLKYHKMTAQYISKSHINANLFEIDHLIDINRLHRAHILILCMCTCVCVCACVCLFFPCVWHGCVFVGQNWNGAVALYSANMCVCVCVCKRGTWKQHSSLIRKLSGTAVKNK